MDKIIFIMIDVVSNKTYSCSLCGSVISEYDKALPNQALHISWHEKLDKQIKMSGLGFPGVF